MIVSPSTIEIQATGVVFSKKGMFLHAVTGVDEFWVRLGRTFGWGKFSICGERCPATLSGIFELTETLPTNAPDPDPIVSEIGVLFRRKAALEAEKTRRLIALEYPDLDG